MPKYVIERTVPEAEKMTQDELGQLAAQSNGVLAEMGSGIQWVQSYVGEDRIYCVYDADSKELIQDHAQRGGFPCDSIREVSAIIDPSTGGA